MALIAVLSCSQDDNCSGHSCTRGMGGTVVTMSFWPSKLNLATTLFRESTVAATGMFCAKRESQFYKIIYKLGPSQTYAAITFKILLVPMVSKTFLPNLGQRFSFSSFSSCPTVWPCTISPIFLAFTN